MKKSEAFPSRFWKAADLDEPIVLTIAFVTREKLETPAGKVEEKPILHFADNKRQLVLNVTNWESIVDITGEEDDSGWMGEKIELYRTTTEMGGKQTPCIRVRVPGAAPKPKPKPEPRKSLHEEMDDSVDF
jgi:hypothetical protein